MAEQTLKGLRTCAVCGSKAPKSELYRIVREETAVSYDPTGKVSGRGAYVCSLACLETALKTKRLERALRTSLAQEDTERIVASIRSASCEAQR